MVISWRSTGGIVAIWLAAVIGVSATASVAIDRAGKDLTGVTVKAVPPAAPVNTPTLTPTPTPTSQPSTTSTKPAATQKPPASQKAPATTRSATPSVTRTRRSAPAHRTPWRVAPRASATPAPTPTPTPNERSISVTGGLVSVRCTGETIALRIAQPEFDWRVHVNTYDGRIYVSFLTGDEESARKTLVTAVCRTGTPDFTVTRG
jgi:hypothetical protein